MADPKFDLLTWVIQHLTEFVPNSRLARGAVTVMFVLALFHYALKGLLSLIEQATKLAEKLGDLGILSRLRPAMRLEIKRRSQFCKALESDLATLARSENWNDQYFAELEAEVEAEGSYFLSRLHKVFRWKSFGIRRVSSLTSAIGNSTERRILVVGDPGAGKSIALRHLASAYAAKAAKSKAIRATVPLYINLREFTPTLGELNGSAVRDFVFEHVRRGDPDTAAYMKEKWHEYKDDGRWMFLFDSFDEIPDILHAPTGSDKIQRYSEAIRHFLDTAPDCRGVIASREFKGPRHLAWHRFRILQLDDRRQSDLIDCTILTSEHRDAIRRHVANSPGATFRNPMLLSLLCRFVKEYGEPPKNDFDLLIRHIEHLSAREPDFTMKRFGMTATQIMVEAGILAKAIAERGDLGLAPTFDDLISARLANYTAEQTLKILEALVELKIGRVDVPSARQGDRRFAFSHRRYQEILYVMYLRTHGLEEGAHQLLTDPRWREYAVTIFQSQPSDVIDRLASHATALLQGMKDRPALAALEPPVGDELQYGLWIPNSLTHLLGLLKEGYSNRRSDILPAMMSAISAVLRPRWEDGDGLDVQYAVEFSGLLDADDATDVLRAAIDLKLRPVDDEITRAIAYSGLIPHALRTRFYRGLSNATLRANSEVEVLRIDAMAARLPSASGAGIVFARSRELRKWLKWPRIIFEAVLWPLGALFPFLKREIELSSQRHAVALMMIVFPTVVAISDEVLHKSAHTPHFPRWLKIVTICWGLVWMVVLINLTYRDQPKPITVWSLFKDICRLPITIYEELDFLALAFLLGIPIMLLIPGGVVHVVARLLGYRGVTLEWYFYSGMIAILGTGLYTIGARWFARRSALRYLEYLRTKDFKQLRPSVFALLLGARSLAELYVWLSEQFVQLAPSIQDQRSMLRILRAEPPDSVLNKLQDKFPLISTLPLSVSSQMQRAVCELLLEKLRVEA